MHQSFNKYVPDVSKCRHVRSPGPVWTVISRSRYAPNITIIFQMSTWMILWMAWLPSWFSWSRSWNEYLAAGLYLQDDPEVFVREQEDWHKCMLLTRILLKYARTVPYWKPMNSCYPLYPKSMRWPVVPQRSQKPIPHLISFPTTASSVPEAQESGPSPAWHRPCRFPSQGFCTHTFSLRQYSPGVSHPFQLLAQA